MGDVVTIPRKEPLIWVCQCGCSTFKVYENQELECAQCGTMASAQGEWVKEPVPFEPRDAPKNMEKVTTFRKTAGMVFRDLMDEAKDMAVILAIRESGKHTVWAEDCDTPERIDWLDRQFALARKMIVRG